MLFDNFPVLDVTRHDQIFGEGHAANALADYDRIPSADRVDANDQHPFDEILVNKHLVDPRHIPQPRLHDRPSDDLLTKSDESEYLTNCVLGILVISVAIFCFIYLNNQSSNLKIVRV